MMSIKKNVSFLLISGKGKKFQVCCQKFSNENEILKMQISIIDVATRTAYKTQVSKSDLTGSEESIEAAFAASELNALELKIDTEQNVMTLSFKNDYLLQNVKCSKEDFVSMQRQMFELAIDESNANDEKLKSLKSRQLCLKNNLGEQQKMLTEVVAEKASIENSMYANFLPILKSKSEKVGELLKRVKTLESSSTAASPGLNKP